MNKLGLLSWRRRATITFASIFAVAIVYLIGSYIVANFKPTTHVRLSSGNYSLWVADNEEERVQGLSGVEELQPNGGLIMVFDTNDTHGIWMKDMNFPLDIIWLNEDKKVVYLVESAIPESPAETVYAPRRDSKYVIELPNGSIKASGIKQGDVAEFTIDV